MSGAHRLFCFGLGYTGTALAESLLAEGWRVAGTTRDAARAVSAMPCEVLRFDRDHRLSDPGAALAGTTHLLLSVPPDEAGDAVLDAHAADIAALRGLVWAGYLSTTGVYGDSGGAWVDEASPLRPTGARGRRRVVAEAGWLALRRSAGVPVHVFRLAGIYGPGRSALDRVRADNAQRIEAPGHVVSRIHVEDIVASLRASMARPRPGAVYNLCDDEPAAPGDVVAHACALLRVPVPELVPLAEADLSPMARSFYADSRRVANRRLKEELGIKLAYPDYRAGLAAILAAEAGG